MLGTSHIYLIRLAFLRTHLRMCATNVIHTGYVLTFGEEDSPALGIPRTLVEVHGCLLLHYAPRATLMSDVCSQLVLILG